MRKSTLALLLGLTSFGSQAGVTATNCLIAEPAPNARVTGIFFDATFEITDEVKSLRLPSPEAIQGASIEGISGVFEVHKTEVKDGVMKMKRIPNARLKPNGTVPFRKGGLHLMLKEFDKRPVAGEEYKLTLWTTYVKEPTCVAKVVKSSEIPMMPAQPKQ